MSDTAPAPPHKPPPRGARDRAIDELHSLLAAPQTYGQTGWEILLIGLTLAHVLGWPAQLHHPAWETPLKALGGLQGNVRADPEHFTPDVAAGVIRLAIAGLGPIPYEGPGQ